MATASERRRITCSSNCSKRPMTGPSSDAFCAYHTPPLVTVTPAEESQREMSVYAARSRLRYLRRQRGRPLAGGVEAKR